MPEGPELLLASRFINNNCKELSFSGKIQKSQISKCPPVTWDAKLYRISACSRGKEVKLRLTEILDEKKVKTKNEQQQTVPEPRTLGIIFRYGLSGKFRLDPISDIHKHAHLNFFTDDGKAVLSYVDQMRFGSWEVNDSWGKVRGGCVLQEYPQFRENVLSHLKSSVFSKPICEVLLNQRYFNGIGNYLRAEILYRAGIKPFEEARAVLEPLCGDNKIKCETPDILELCNKMSWEVVNLSSADQSGYGEYEESSAFADWLQCYYNPKMNSISDHNGRTIWFSGDTGPLAPKEIIKRHQKNVQKKIPTKVAANIGKIGKDRKQQKPIKPETGDEGSSPELEQDSGQEFTDTKPPKPSKRPSTAKMDTTEVSVTKKKQKESKMKKQFTETCT